jgi:hypothetical protein
MVKTTIESLADLEIELTWEINGISHREIYFADEANLYRDYFPNDIGNRLLNKSEGERIDFFFEQGELVPAYSDSRIHKVWYSQCHLHALPGHPAKLKVGRFYPKGILGGIAGIFRENITPFRVIDTTDRMVESDFNHPLADIPLAMSITVRSVKSKKKERGGLSNDWIGHLSEGPGIQSRYEGRPSDYFSGNPFSREDGQDDAIFYEKDRFVSHIDEQSRANLEIIYKNRIPEGSLVLDLMSSWQSHVPEDLDLEGLVGLGMNENELKSNTRLTQHKVHDLNTSPSIPFGNDVFDAVICSLSIEYLARPFDVFRDIARVLKPGGNKIGRAHV